MTGMPPVQSDPCGHGDGEARGAAVGEAGERAHCQEGADTGHWQAAEGRGRVSGGLRDPAGGGQGAGQGLSARVLRRLSGWHAGNAAQVVQEARQGAHPG